ARRDPAISDRRQWCIGDDGRAVAQPLMMRVVERAGGVRTARLSRITRPPRCQGGTAGTR
ncbi:MAG TPA: hypothetical protein VE690_24280, partial [Rhodopila sp.]|nr:hypothetical protein [Rhodopila sp.]